MSVGRGSSRRRGLGGGALAVVVVGLLAMTAVAIAKAPTIGAGRAKVAGHTETIAVNSKGVAVYELSPETSHHLLCTSAMCLKFWPPVKVSPGTKVTTGAGVSGKLGTLKRKGFTQVTLNGIPLYTFLEDGGKPGVANGNGIMNFGGTWHVFKEK
jgi:predicted lipoprotein with Yx(FWY)xxD motif